MNNTELYHWGIKGQKWGNRRFQNPDGSLTELGKERYGRYENGGKRVGASTYRKGDAAYLSDDEMRARIDRIRLEQEYLKLLPDERSKGQRFLEDVVTPTAVDLGKKQAGKVLDKAGDVAAEWAKKKLSEQLGVDLDSVESSAKYLAEDASKLSTKKLNERTDRLRAEDAYKRALNGDFSKGDGKKDKKNKGGNSDDGDSDNGNQNGGKNKGGQTTINNYYYGERRENAPSESKSPKAPKQDSQSAPEEPRQTWVKHTPTPENARMPSAPSSNKAVYNEKENKVSWPSESPYVNSGTSNGKYQYGAPPQKTDPRVFDRGEKAYKVITESSRYDESLSSSISYVETGEDVVNRWKK